MCHKIYRHSSTITVIAVSRAPVIASEGEAIQLETGEKLRVPNRHCERTSAPTVIANEREAIQLTPAISLPTPQPHANHQLDCIAHGRNDAPLPVIASEGEAIQLMPAISLPTPQPHANR